MAGEGKREMRQCRPDPYLVKTRASMRAPASASLMRGLHSSPCAQVTKGSSEAGSTSPGSGVGKARSAQDAFCRSFSQESTALASSSRTTRSPKKFAQYGWKMGKPTASMQPPALLLLLLLLLAGTWVAPPSLLLAPPPQASSVGRRLAAVESPAEAWLCFGEGEGALCGATVEGGHSASIAFSTSSAKNLRSYVAPGYR
mmetsp:Transcript_27108/g.73281  ORF Transcript_27108/g.73281 Transcript_27108/m.73281 type:complete len:200 (-) Transcript_27108:606-1205(-)